MSTSTAAQAAFGPHVSVVVVWGPNGAELPAWVSRVAEVAGKHRLEVVVVTTDAEFPTTAVSAEGKARIRNLRFTHVTAPVPARVMRRAGMAAATGDVVLLTESGDRDFEFRLAALLRQLEARWGNLSWAEPLESEPDGASPGST